MAKVYSTEFGRLCPDCGEPEHQGKCATKHAVLGDGKVRIRRETKGRKGAGVTLVEGIPLDEAALKKLHKLLKKKCSVGGALKQGVMEFQGDQREKLLSQIQALPEAKSWDIKLSGG